MITKYIVFGVMAFVLSVGGGASLYLKTHPASKVLPAPISPQFGASTPEVEAPVKSSDSVAMDTPKSVKPEKPKPPILDSRVLSANKTKSAPKSAPSIVKKLPAPAPTPAPAPAPAANTILNLINAARLSAGLNAVTYNSKLNAAALAKSKDMSNQNYFSHTNPQEKTDFQFIKEAGYNYSAAGSNIAQGNFAGDRGVFDAWMASPGHKANILASFGQNIGYAGYNGYYTLLIAEPL